MSELPQVGQTYQHKRHGDVTVDKVTKRGRGYQVWWFNAVDAGPDNEGGRDRLKDWQKATT